jgi:DNA-binding winged helix-turn-helix (wHTH) protein
VLLDALDEFPLTANDPAQAIAFLEPLLGTLELIQCQGIAFKFFLPQELESSLRACGWFRADRLHIFRIAWDRDNLLSLFGQRLIHFSQRRPPFEALGQLCEDELASIINDELVALSEESPRAILILADKLLQSHCQQSDIPESITLQTWERVKDWWRRERHTDFVEKTILPGAPPQTTGAVDPSDRAIFDYPVLRVEEEKHLVWLGERDITSEIKTQDYRVLLCLYQNRDKVCTKDLLAEQAWAEAAESGAGIADQTIAASIGRLRRALKQSLPSKGYIETVRGYGYRLHPRGFKASAPVEKQ